MATDGGGDTPATDNKRTGVNYKDCQGMRSVDSTASSSSSCLEMAEQQEQAGTTADNTGSDTGSQESYSGDDGSEKGQGSTGSHWKQPQERRTREQESARANLKPAPSASTNLGESSCDIRNSITLPQHSFAVGLPVLEANGKLEPNGGNASSQSTAPNHSTKPPVLKRELTRFEQKLFRSRKEVANNEDSNEGREQGDYHAKNQMDDSSRGDNSNNKTREPPHDDDDAVKRWFIENSNGKSDHQKGSNLSRDTSPTRAGSMSPSRKRPAFQKSNLKRGTSFDPSIKNPFATKDRPSRRIMMMRAQSQPLLYPDEYADNTNNIMRELQSQQVTMTERLIKFRNSVSTRPVRLKKTPSRSKSHIPSTMSQRHLLGKIEEKATEEDNDEEEREQHGSKGQSRVFKRMPPKVRSLPLPLPSELDTSRRRKNTKAFRERADQGGRTGSNSSRRHYSADSGSDHEEEKTADNDVLLMIAKARAKLEMQGNGSDDAARLEAETVMEQMTQQQQQNDRDEREKQKESLAASSGHSRPRSATSSAGGTASYASLPGAYEKLPGGGFERKRAFSQSSIMRQHMANTKTHQKQSQQQDDDSHQSYDSFADSESGSISSNDNESVSELMEIEFSQDSISNDDESGWGWAKKPAAKDVGAHKGESVSPCASASSLSLGPDELFAEQKKPATRTKTKKGTPRRTGSAKSGGGSSSRGHTSFASLPAMSGLSDSSDIGREYDSDVSIYTRRRRRRTNRRDHRGRYHQSRQYDQRRRTSSYDEYVGNQPSESDHRRRTSSYDEYVGNSELKKSMKDGSTESTTSQLAIAAEVVQSEEEMVQELRQRVTKELLESMAKELNEMEASMMSQSALMGMSGTANDHGPSTPSGTRTGMMQRMNRQGQEWWKPTADPTTPMSTSMQFMAKSGTPASAAGRLGRSLNLSAASPRFLRVGRSPGSAMKHFSGKKKILPKLTLLDSESSSDDSDMGITTRHSTGNLDIVDAVSVIADPDELVPAHRPHSIPRRSVSQPTTPTSRPKSTIRHLPSGSGTHQAHLRPGSLLDQLRATMTGAGSSTAASATLQEATYRNTLQRWGSGRSLGSLPDLMSPPSLTAGTSQGTVRSYNGRPSERITPPSRRQQFHVAPRPPSVSSLHSVNEMSSRTPTPSSMASFLESSGNDDDDDDDNSLNPAARSQEQDGVVEYHVVNPHERSYRDVLTRTVTDIPSDWDLEQMERAELGSHHSGSRPFTRGSFAVMGNNNNNWHGHQQQQPLMISYDNELPIVWAAPVCLLVVGAVVLAVVLFAV